ncbi:hypothetical protein AVEN_31395-1 [Araneus ventricosus]|uniref:Uncharacterized protein n=1 Tax=Araneus ventricosus TaxID=182803 RepID=A0A4Y2F4A1_ARAVE|nr:hypothetical protein AVEN_31395-1 [Araneus ventricosus]
MVKFSNTFFTEDCRQHVEISLHVVLKLSLTRNLCPPRPVFSSPENESYLRLSFEALGNSLNKIFTSDRLASLPTFIVNIKSAIFKFSTSFSNGPVAHKVCSVKRT